MKRPGGILGTVLLALILAAGSVAAQTDWMQKGKDMLGGFGKSATGEDSLTSGEIGAGLKDALLVGTENVVSRLGTADGFNADPSVHIPLPKNFKTVQSALSKVGKSALLDDLELRLNRAAEVATPKAKALFVQAISDMTLDDVTAIYKGPDDAATRYFQSKMSEPLAGEMAPIVDQSLAQVGAVQAYDKAMEQYRALPFVPDVKANLTNYVVQKGSDGIFYYLAQEEAAIRKDPVKRTTDLLQRVFGAQ